jgi:hypothetical protein
MVGYFPVFVFSSTSEAVSRRKIAADIDVGTPVGMKFSKHDGTFLAGRPYVTSVFRLTVRRIDRPRVVDRFD